MLYCLLGAKVDANSKMNVSGKDERYAPGIENKLSWLRSL